MKTRDIDIRKYLHNCHLLEFQCNSSTIVVDELSLCQGDARVDVAVINGSIHGYEIKSESDTLERLPAQMTVYCKVLDTVTVVTGKCHTQKILDMVPDWWGVTEASKEMDSDFRLSIIRESTANESIDPFSLVQLLWRSEALSILKVLGLEKGMLSKPRRVLWQKLVDSVLLEDLKFYTREQLKSRTGWRS